MILKDRIIKTFKVTFVMADRITRLYFMYINNWEDKQDLNGNY